MTDLRQALADYLAMRRAMGSRLARAEKLLAQFLTYLEERGQTRLSIANAVAWATKPTGADPSWSAHRLGAVRGFATYLHTIDPATEIPPAHLLPTRSLRATPYPYTDDEVAAVLAAAAALRTAHRVATYRTLIGLLVVTGMRVGEAIALDRHDFDAGQGLITVRRGKFGKSRELPLHPSATAAVGEYLQRADRPTARQLTSALFVSTAGTRLLYCNVQHTFHALVRRAGLAPHSASCRPRLHDIRHRFAVRTLLDAYRQGHDPEARLALLADLSRTHRPQAHLLVLVGRAGTDATGRRAPRTSSGRPAMSALASIIEAFFTDRLVRQRHASPHTIAAYRDTWRLLIRFAATEVTTAPSKLKLGDLDAPLIGRFLEHLERDRANTARTRNARLSAIHALFRYAALEHPDQAAVIARVLAIPPKRGPRGLVTFLSDVEVDALLAAPDRATWTGRRDHTLLALAIQTGLRASELTALRCADLNLARGAHVNCLGKGRKQRITPLTKAMVVALRTWLVERAGSPDTPVFPTRTGRPLSRDALAQRLAIHVATATSACPSLREKNITPHTLRLTAAMRLLHAGVDTTVIALWLGHENVDTTNIYIHADLALKERALARITPAGVRPGRYRPPDRLLAFLEGL